MHDTVDQGEQGIIFRSPDVTAWMELRAALPNDDAAGSDRLTAEHLHSQALTGGLATVSNQIGRAHV